MMVTTLGNIATNRWGVECGNHCRHAGVRTYRQPEGISPQLSPEWRQCTASCEQQAEATGAPPDNAGLILGDRAHKYLPYLMIAGGVVAMGMIMRELQ